MPVWAYFDRTALPYGASPNRLVYALCKLRTTFSAEDRKTIDDNTSAAANERKKLAAELGIIAGHQDTSLRHLLSCIKADAGIKMFSRSKLIESKEKRSSARTIGSVKRIASSSSEALPEDSSATKFQRVEQARMPDYLSGCRCGKGLLYNAHTHESLVADMVSVFQSVSFNVTVPDTWGCYSRGLYSCAHFRSQRTTKQG
jgi:hypothetical protein